MRPPITPWLAALAAFATVVFAPAGELTLWRLIAAGAAMRGAFTAVGWIVWWRDRPPRD